MVAKVPVPKFQKPREYIQVEPGATAGATIGKDVYSEDGKTLWVPPTPATPQSPNSTRVFWINILDVPPNVKALAETVSAGLYVVTGAGASATRAIEAEPGETTVADGDGIAGNPTIGLADVTPTAGGSILRVAFDAKGRRSQEDTATTDNLPEGSTNLYFTAARVLATVLAGLSTATNAAITAADTVLSALGKLQAQITAAIASIATKQDALTNSTTNTISGTQVLRAALTGDVTASANSNATTIANNAVSNTKLADMATQTIKGRTTAGTGDPEDLTGAQARAVIGAEPVIAGGTTGQFWRGDKSWSNTLDGVLNVANNAGAPGLLGGLFGQYIAAPNGAPSFVMLDAFGSSSGALFRRSNGTSASPTAVSGNDILGQFQARAHDGTSYSDNETCAIWFEANGTWNNASHPSRISFFTTPTSAVSPSRRLVIDTAGEVRPGQDNVLPLGTPGFRWSVVYAATGTINTSDAREKTQVSPMTDAEIAASKTLASEIGAYRWLDAIKDKGDSARLHIGLTVQRAIEVMKSHGLDPFRYGFICYDKWDEAPEVIGENGKVVQEYRPAGDRYSFRMDELTLFIARGMEERIAALEKAVASYSPSAPAG